MLRFVTGKSSGILSDISSGILSSISSGISSGILHDISSNTLFGISSGILSGRWGPAVHAKLGRSQVEVQRCTLSWEGPRLRSRSQVEVQRCTLSWFGRRLRSSGAHWAGKLAKSLAKSWQGGSWSWCRHDRGETGGGGGRRRRRRTRRRRTRTRRTASRGEQLDKI